MKITSIKPVSGELFPTDVIKVDYLSDVDGLADWTLFYPGNLEAPTVVCLHGYGSTGDQLYTRRDIREHWLTEFRRYNCPVLTPNLRGGVFMNPAAVTDLHQLLAFFRHDRHCGRFIFFSGSMGGSGNLIYAVRHPEDVAALASLGAVTDIASFYDWAIRSPLPIVQEIAASIATAYDGTPAENPEPYRRHSVCDLAGRLTMPIFAAHGGSDTIIDVEQSRRLAKIMTGKTNFSYHEIPDGNHDSPLFLPGVFARLITDAGQEIH